MPVSALAILFLFLLVGAVAGVVLLITAQRRGRDGTYPTCGRCGYNLTGSASNRCPECGALFIEAGVAIGSPSPKRSRWVLAGGLVLSILFVAGIGLSLSYRAASQARAQAQASAQLSQRLRAIEMRAASDKTQRQESKQQAEESGKGDP